MLGKIKEMAEWYVRSKGLHTGIRVFFSGEELVGESGEYDVLLLDLMLPGMDGVEVARRFDGRSRIIFVTAYKEYALDAFDVGAVHYLVKPVTKERLFLALDRAREQLGQTGCRTLALIKNGGFERILTDSIMCCEVFGHRLCIYTADSCYEYSGTLDMLEGQLDGRFFRCHRSFLVNMAHILSVDRGTAVLDSGDRVLVSRRRQQELMQRLLFFLKDEVTGWER